LEEYNVLTIDDILFTPNRTDVLESYTVLIFGIDGIVQYSLTTFDWFADVLNETTTFIDKTDQYNDDLKYVGIVNNEELVETVQVPEVLWALLLSECDIMELGRDARVQKTPEEFGPNYWVSAGWSYVKTETGFKYTAPDGWVAPTSLSLEARKDYYINIKEVLKKGLTVRPELTDQITEYLETIKTQLPIIEQQIKDRDG